MKTHAERFLLAHADRQAAAGDMATAAEMMQAVRASTWGVSDDLYAMLDKAAAAYREADNALLVIAGEIGSDARYDEWAAAEDSTVSDTSPDPLPAALALDVMQAARGAAVCSNCEHEARWHGNHGAGKCESDECPCESFRALVADPLARYCRECHADAFDSPCSCSPTPVKACAAPCSRCGFLRCCCGELTTPARSVGHA